MKKLLIVHNEFGLSGAPVAAYNLVKQLKDKYQVTCVSPSSGTLEKLYSELKVETRVIPNLMGDPSVAYSIAEGFDLAIVYCTPCYFSAIGLTNAGVPTIFYLHESKAAGTQLVSDQIFAKLALSKVAALVFNSQYAYDLFNHLHTNKNTHIIPIGMDIPDASIEYKPVLNKDPNKKYLLQIGSVEHRKGNDIFTKAIIDAPKTFEGVIVGRVLDPGLKAQIDSVSQGRVHFVGEVSQETVKAFIKHADGLVMASRDETLPTVILDSMAMGLPVISSDVGAIPEVIKNGQTGYLFESGSPESLTKKIKEAFGNKNLSKIVDNAKKLVLENRTVEIHGNKFVELIESLTQSK